MTPGAHAPATMVLPKSLPLITRYHMPSVGLGTFQAIAGNDA
jgi:hypothetical protein